MSSAVFPSLIGQFRKTRTPEFNTNIFESVSGKEYRSARRNNPRSTFELAFDYLPAATDLATLWGFYVARQGDYDSFLIAAVDDSSILGQALGTGDGSTTAFQLKRTMGGGTETILAPNAVAAVYDNGSPVAGAGWSVSSWGAAAPGVVTFVTPPLTGHAITADFTYYWPVRFNDPSLDFERFMNLLYQVQSLKVKQLL